MDDDDDAGYCFEITLQMKHPTLHPSTLTEALGVAPKGCWAAGELRTTPKGTLLEGVYKETYWYISEQIVRRRKFFDAYLDFITRHLECRPDFVASFIATGGRVAVNVGVPGNGQIGDVITAEGLSRIAKLGITMGIEVF